MDGLVHSQTAVDTINILVFPPFLQNHFSQKYSFTDKKSQGLVSRECDACFTDLHCHRARTGSITSGVWPVQYGSISALQSWWKTHTILYIQGCLSDVQCQSQCLTVVSSIDWQVIWHALYPVPHSSHHKL